MLYTVEGLFKVIEKINRKYTDNNGEQQQFTINQIVLENPNNFRDIIEIEFNDEKFKIDEEKFKGKSVVVPAYLNKNKSKKNGNIYYNWKLRGEISLSETSSKTSKKEDDINEGLFKR